MNILNQFKAMKIEIPKSEKIMAVIKYLENLDENETKAVLGSLPKEGFLQNDIVDYFFEDARRNEKIPVEKNEFTQLQYSARNKLF